MRVCFLQHALQLTLSNETYSLFLKFHKVAGETFRAYVDRLSGTDYDCQGNCGCGDPDWPCYVRFPSKWQQEDYKDCMLHSGLVENMTCAVAMKSCTCHQSLSVIRQAVSGVDLTTRFPDLADVRNLWTDEERFKLLWKVEWARGWLPASFRHKRLLITTILRDPMERIRSYYYFVNPTASHEEFLPWLEFRRDFVAGNATAEQYEKQLDVSRGATSYALLLRSCCEYETYLGDGSVAQAKRTLTTQFNLVAIKERMNEGLVSLGRLYGLSPEQMAAVDRELQREGQDDVHDNGDGKLEWTGEERRLTEFVAQNSSEIYAFAQELYRRQTLQLFGSAGGLRDAVSRFEDLTAKAS